VLKNASSCSARPRGKMHVGCRKGVASRLRARHLFVGTSRTPLRDRRARRATGSDAVDLRRSRVPSACSRRRLAVERAALGLPAFLDTPSRPARRCPAREPFATPCYFLPAHATRDTRIAPRQFARPLVTRSGSRQQAPSSCRSPRETPAPSHVMINGAATRIADRTSLVDMKLPIGRS